MWKHTTFSFSKHLSRLFDRATLVCKTDLQVLCCHNRRNMLQYKIALIWLKQTIIVYFIHIRYSFYTIYGYTTVKAKFLILQALHHYGRKSTAIIKQSLSFLIHKSFSECCAKRSRMLCQTLCILHIASYKDGHCAYGTTLSYRSKNRSDHRTGTRPRRKRAMQYRGCAAG